MPLKPACNVPGCHFIRELFGAGPSDPEDIRTSTRAPTVPFSEETRNYEFTSAELLEIANEDRNVSDKSRLERPSLRSIRADPDRADDRFSELRGFPPSSPLNAEEFTLQQFKDKPRLERPLRQSVRAYPDSADNRFWELPENPPSSQLNADELTAQRPYRSSQKGLLKPVGMRNGASSYRSLNLTAESRTCNVQSNDHGAIVAMPSVAARPSVDNVLNAETDALKGSRTRAVQTNGNGTVGAMPSSVAMPSVGNAVNAEIDALKAGQLYQNGPRTPPGGSPRVGSPPITQALPNHELAILTSQSQQDAIKPSLQPEPSIEHSRESQQFQLSPIPIPFPHNSQQRAPFAPNPVQQNPTLAGGASATQQPQSPQPYTYPQGALHAVNPSPNISSTTVSPLRAVEPADSATSLATLEDTKNKLSPQAYLNALDATSQQLSITPSATLGDMLTEVGPLVPPLCPALVVPQSESRFGMALSELATVESNATVTVVSLSGKSLLTMLIREPNKIEVYLAMHVDTPRCTILIPTGEEPFDILDSMGSLYGRFMKTALNVHEVVVQRQRVLSLQGSSKTMNFSVTTPGGEPVALARRNAADYRGGEHFEIRTLPGADTVLVTACLLAIVLYTSPE